jgi:pyruvate,water dikinase
MNVKNLENQWFFALGSGRAAGSGIGNKAALLDRAAERGLPVPAGIVLRDEARAAAIERGLVRLDNGRHAIPDPRALFEFLNFPAFSGLVAVRSAFSAEDNVKSSLAGHFHSELNVPGEAKNDLAAAIAHVWDSASDARFRRDVLILEMVPARHAGVAFTERDFADDAVNFTDGLADGLLAGQIEGRSFELSKREGIARPGQPAFAGRLHELLTRTRAVFGPGDWDLEWADDGQTCFLIQVRPITRPTRRNERFTIANHKEILPPLPSRFMTSVIGACAEELFSYYREFDPTLPAGRSFIEVFRGRPFINLSLLTEMMRHWGLPTRLVTDSIGGHDDDPFPLHLPTLVSKIPVLLRLGFSQLRAEAAAERRVRWLNADRPVETFSEGVAALRALYAGLVREMFSLTQAISGPVAFLKAAGTLAELSRTLDTVSTRMLTDLAPLRDLARANPSLRATLAAGRLPDDPEFQCKWNAYLEVHGHRGIFESDVARPRFREDPTPLLRAIAAEPAAPVESATSFKALACRPVWAQARRAIEARERLRSAGMKAFERVRESLLRLAARAVAEGRLPNVEALWNLEVEEVRRLDAGWIPDAAFFADRAAEQARFAEYDFPDVFQRNDDFEEFRRTSGPPDDSPRLTGVSLTAGKVTGRAWVLAEPETDRPASLSGEEPVVLIARSVDAGWIPTFAGVAGVVVETGGDLSHGSIILREIGLPAITNVRGATRRLVTGDLVTLFANEGAVERRPSGN